MFDGQQSSTAIDRKCKQSRSQVRGQDPILASQDLITYKTDWISHELNGEQGCRSCVLPRQISWQYSYKHNYIGKQLNIAPEEVDTQDSRVVYMHCRKEYRCCQP